MILIRFDELGAGDEFALSNYRYVKIHRCKCKGGKKYLNAVAFPFYKDHLDDNADRITSNYKSISGKEYVGVHPEWFVSRYNRMNLVDKVGGYSSGLILDIASSLGLKPIMEKALKYDRIREALNS